MGRLLEDLGARVDAAAIGVTVGTNLFLGVLPDTTVDVGSLIEYDGLTPLHRHTETSASMTEMPRVQLMWRSDDYNTGMDIIRAVWLALEATNITIDGTFYQRIQADSNPFHMGRDENDRWLFAANFTVTKEAA